MHKLQTDLGDSIFYQTYQKKHNYAHSINTQYTCLQNSIPKVRILHAFTVHIFSLKSYWIYLQEKIELWNKETLLSIKIHFISPYFKNIKKHAILSHFWKWQQSNISAREARTQNNQNRLDNFVYWVLFANFKLLVRQSLFRGYVRKNFQIPSTSSYDFWKYF